jgi:hypothetical protein
MRNCGAGSYRELFCTPEFTLLFASSCAQIAATTLNGLALAALAWVDAIFGIDRVVAETFLEGWRPTESTSSRPRSA